MLHRGLRERSAQAKRKTAHITGNMCSLLSDRQDIVPYLPLLLPELQAVLTDPIPEVRSTGAKALGRLCAGLGEEQIPQLLPWLLRALCHDGAAVERAGFDRSVARGAAATAWRAWRDAAHLASSLAALGARMKQAANPAPVPNP